MASASSTECGVGALCSPLPAALPDGGATFLANGTVLCNRFLQAFHSEILGLAVVERLLDILGEPLIQIRC